MLRNSKTNAMLTFCMNRYGSITAERDIMCYMIRRDVWKKRSKVSADSKIAWF